MASPVIDSSAPGLLNETHVPTLEPRSHFSRFLLVLLLIPALLYLATFPLVRVASLGFENWGPSKWGPVLNFPFHAQHVDADIVVFGDSTAFLGIDPRTVSKEVGVTSVVLPNTIGSLPVINDLALERYLEHNKPPRLLVFYFAVWNLDYEHNNMKQLYFEGEEMLLRNGSWGQIATYAMHHPADALAFPLQLNSTVSLSTLKDAVHGSRAREVAQTLGHRDYTEVSSALRNTCLIPSNYLQQQSDSSIQALVRKYEARHINVAVYLAPIPDCRNTSSITQRSFSSLASRPPATLPASGFADDGFYGHLRPAEVPAASDLFAQALRGRTEMATAFEPRAADSALIVAGPKVQP